MAMEYAALFRGCVQYRLKKKGAKVTEQNGKLEPEDDIFHEFLRNQGIAKELYPSMTEIKLNRGEFYQQLNELHTLFMAGDISLGTMAVRMGITKVGLIHLLDWLHMHVTNI